MKRLIAWKILIEKISEKNKKIFLVKKTKKYFRWGLKLSVDRFDFVFLA